MRILISGASGLIGSSVADAARKQGHEVAPLVRPSGHPPNADGQTKGVAWDPAAGTIDPSADAADCVVHLAGASIGEGRWTAKRKQVLRDSRVAATRQLVSALGKLTHPPRVFIAASAIGFYGDRGDEVLTEASSPGSDFLAVLCRDWEAESSRAADFGARVAILRFGIVLAKDGGALPRMALPFRLGAGGRIGSGSQWISWITLQDVVAAIGHAMTDDRFSGTANVVSPHPARNVDFTRTLARVLHRPALFPAPAFALRLALGEMADALLLTSQRVQPDKLAELGYRMAHHDLEQTLESVLR